MIVFARASVCTPAHAHRAAALRMCPAAPTRAVCIAYAATLPFSIGCYLCLSTDVAHVLYAVDKIGGFVEWVVIAGAIGLAHLDEYFADR
jgi:hypothetical protein